MSYRSVFVLIMMGIFPVIGNAQEISTTEIYVGFPLLYRSGSSQLFGVHTAFTVNARKWLGLSSEASVNIGEVFADKSILTLHSGPVFSAPVGSKVRPFVHTLIGFARSGCGEFVNGCRSTSVLSGLLGGGIDFQTGWRVRLRAQGDKLVTTFNQGHQQFFRASFGFVIPLQTPKAKAGT
jgi:hypothetical protein